MPGQLATRHEDLYRLLSHAQCLPDPNNASETRSSTRRSSLAAPAKRIRVSTRTPLPKHLST